MVSRLTFLESISGIQYPEMLVNFFDQFIALKQLIEDKGSITVNNSDDRSITFIASFIDRNTRDEALSNIQTNYTVIYGKTISILTDIISDTEIKVILQ